MEPIQENPDENNFTARPYQDQLLQVCLQKNSIIYLPTGSGKTFIALMAMRHFAKNVDRPLHEGGQRLVFLANTIVLAQQQSKVIEKATNLRTSVYTGDMNVDAWRKENWVTEFEENQVLVATCQIILDVIRHGYIKMKHLSLIIFDECHHGRREHPMHQLMSHYHKSPVSERPRVIGLTGMLISGSVSPASVVTDLESLENTFHATIATVQNIKEYSNVLLYSTNPNEQLKLYETPAPNLFLQKIQAMINRLIEKVDVYPVDESHQLQSKQKLKAPNVYKGLKVILNDFLYQMQDSGLYGASIAILSVLVELELKKRSSDTSTLKKLVRELITTVELIRHMLVEEMEEDDEDSESIILINASPKMVALLIFLKSYYASNNAKDIKAIVFVQRRYTAKCVYHIIRKFAEKAGDRFPIRPDFIVGTNNRIPESIEQILENKWNRRVLDRFTKNETNLIVASSVLEEGIDLQMCNVVVMYDKPFSFRSYVQTKGRARMRESTYMLMCSAAERIKLETNMIKWKEVDKILKDYLIGKAIDRAPPLEKEIAREFENRLIPPFRTKTGAVLEALSSVQLLNRYCQTLPTDHFTIAAVTWSKELTDKGIIVRIRLPMQSSVRDEISSIPTSSLKLSKRSAAFNACVLLYEKGELNDHLMPMSVKRCMTQYKDIYFKIWAKYEEDNPRMAGTMKQNRQHAIKYPEVVTNAGPNLHSDLFVYELIIKAGFTLIEEKNDRNDYILRDLYNSEKTFGILLSKPLPKLGLMKFFVTLGLITVKISNQPKRIRISNENQLRELRNFHCMIFRDVIGTAKPFLVNDFQNEENSYFIVPTVGSEIDWSMVSKFQQLPQYNGSVQKTQKNFRAEDYLHKVIWPWYRTDPNQRYVVTKVHEKLTPNSPFPNDSYQSYAQYVFEKYKGITVQNPTQFLIEVRGITTRLNLLTPGEGKDGSKGYSVSSRGPELLIPEFCHNFELPADYWLKATVLPSILHRFHYLLHADKIRIKINRYLGISCDDYDPEPVIEKMNRTPVIDPQDILNAPAIVFPRPEESQVEKVNKQEIVTSTGSWPWNEIEEPIDINRHVTQLYPFEIDYYSNFITKEMSKMNIGSAEVILRNSHAGPKNPLQLAICDTPSEERLKINILNIKLTTPTQGPLQSDLLAAITAASANDVFDMERFEVLGDAYLKFSVSIYLIQKHTQWHEGILTSCKGQIVSNRNLCYIAFERDIAGMINIRQLNPKNEWRPPLFTVPRNVQEYIKDLNASASCLDRLQISSEERESGVLEQQTLYDFVSGFINEICDQQDSSLMQNFLSRQIVPDKCVADTMEAILGCCVKTMGIERSFSILKMFNILPETEQNYQQMLQAKNYNPRLRADVPNRDIDSIIMNHQELEKSLDYFFNDRAYLLQALTHPSFPTNQVTGCYQQLEFLGDAVLDLLVSMYIFERCPDKNPGQLTDLRSALVNNVTLACLCVRYNFHNHILSQNAVLSEQIRSFVDFQEQHNLEITDQVQLLSEESDLMGEFVDVPKTLGDIVEALIGAVFLDSGYNLERTWRVIYRLLQNEINKFIANTPLQLVRQLYEYPGANPKFDDPVVEDDIVMVSVRFTCKGHFCQVQGFGKNKENAKKAAAKVALQKLKQ